MWALISAVGKVSTTIVWDRESAIGGRSLNRPRCSLAPWAPGSCWRHPRAPEFKGVTERNNGYFETPFRPGREFVSPSDDV